jgi:uncharacterized protein HemX
MFKAFDSGKEAVMKLIVIALLLGISFGSTHAEDIKETKAKVQQDFEQGFESLKVQVRDLQEKAKTASGSAKKDMENQVESLKKDQDDLQAKIQKLKKSSGNAWTDLKDGASSAYENFKKSVRQAQDRFKEEK